MRNRKPPTTLAPKRLIFIPSSVYVHSITSDSSTFPGLHIDLYTVESSYSLSTTRLCFLTGPAGAPLFEPIVPRDPHTARVDPPSRTKRDKGKDPAGQRPRAASLAPIHLPNLQSKSAVIGYS